MGNLDHFEEDSSDDEGGNQASDEASDQEQVEPITQEHEHNSDD